MIKKKQIVKYHCTACGHTWTETIYRADVKCKACGKDERGRDDTDRLVHYGK